MRVEELVAFLTDRRKRRGLSQRQLAAWMGSIQSVLSDHETGRTVHPSFWYLQRWAAALGVQLSIEATVVGQPGDPPPPSLADRVTALERHPALDRQCDHAAQGRISSPVDQ